MRSCPVWEIFWQAVVSAKLPFRVTRTIDEGSGTISLRRIDASGGAIFVGSALDCDGRESETATSTTHKKTILIEKQILFMKAF